MTFDFSSWTSLSSTYCRKHYIEDVRDRYPYLTPRNSVTGKFVDNATYLRGEHDLPAGWWQLFLQMCEDIRRPLIDAGLIHNFQFVDIKEKWGMMRCYVYGANETVINIISKYEQMSRYICGICGAVSTYESVDYVFPLCRKHRKYFDRYRRLKQVRHYTIVHTDDKGNVSKCRCSFKEEMRRYQKGLMYGFRFPYIAEDENET